MNQTGDPELLADMTRRLAARLTDDETSLAWVFARVQHADGLDDAGLARRLDVLPELLPRMAICGRPRADHFRDDIFAVADRFSASRLRLAEVVRQVEALEALRQASAGGASVLLAARDRVAEETAEYESDQDDSGDASGGKPPADDDPGDAR